MNRKKEKEKRIEDMESTNVMGEFSCRVREGSERS